MKPRGMRFGVALATVLCMAVAANASDISQIEALSNGTTCTLDGGVITAILSQPGTFNGKSYSAWSFSVNDGSGSLFVYGTLPSGYTPAVGDRVSVAATYSPYHQIPELGTVTSISLLSSGNPVPAPITPTIAQMNVSTLPLSIAGYMINLNNVTIPDTGYATWGITNITGQVVDAGNDCMTLYYWPTSYSVANVNLYGQTIPSPSTPVNMTGFVSVYSGVSEFTPVSITSASVPEPATMTLLALGGAAFLIRRRKA